MASQTTTISGTRTFSWWDAHQRQLAPYVFIAPFYILFLIFTVFSIAYSFWLSLFKGAGYTNIVFAGAENYLRLFSDHRFIHALINTTAFAACSLFILTPIALLLALALTSRLIPWSLRGFYRLSFFLPFITSQVVISILFTLVLDHRYGLLNVLLSAIGIQGPPWLTGTDWAMRALVLINIWMYLGFNALYWMAGLSSISAELYESAAIDGAGPLRRFWSITLPLLRPITMFMVIQAVIGSYNWFATTYLLTSGGPSDATLSLTLYLYKEAFVYSQFGYANAIGYAMVVIVFILSLINIKLFGGFQRAAES
jgi:ABC-type sugar transport system permease subunit